MLLWERDLDNGVGNWPVVVGSQMKGVINNGDNSDMLLEDSDLIVVYIIAYWWCNVEWMNGFFLAVAYGSSGLMVEKKNLNMLLTPKGQRPFSGLSWSLGKPLWGPYLSKIHEFSCGLILASRRTNF
jgi:hypothetical protein